MRTIDVPPAIGEFAIMANGGHTLVAATKVTQESDVYVRSPGANDWVLFGRLATPAAPAPSLTTHADGRGSA